MDIHWWNLVITTLLSLAIVFITWLIFVNGRLFYFYNIFKKNSIPCLEPKLTLGIMNSIAPALEGHITHEVIEDSIGKFGKVFGFFYGPGAYMVVNDPNIINTILTKHFGSFRNKPSFGGASKAQKSSVLRARDHQWKKYRSVLTPAFIGSKLKIVNQSINNCVMNFMETLESIRKTGDVNISQEIIALSLDVLGNSIISKRMNVKSQSDVTFFDALQNYKLTPFSEWRNPLTIAKDWVSCRKTESVILNHIAGIIPTKDESANPSDILSILMQRNSVAKQGRNHGLVKGVINKELTDFELVSNAQILFVPGYRAVATAMSFVFYVLAKNPHIQDRLYDEISSTLKDGKAASYEEIQSMRYLDMVVNETLRLYPSLPYNVVREARHDITIDGVFIPKGVIVMAPMWHFHHSEEHWANAQEFDPERFSAENKLDIKPGSYLPFGLGPRNCIGLRLALLEAKLTISQSIYKYRLSLSPKTVVPVQVSMSKFGLVQKSKIYITLSER